MRFKLQISNTRHLLVAQIFSGAVSLVVLFFSARIAGSSVIGTVAIAIVISGVVIDIFDYGACSYYSTKLAAGDSSKEDYWRVSSQKQSLILLISMIIVAPTILVSRDISLIYFIVYPSLWLRMNYVQQYFFSTGQYKQAVIAIYSDKLSYVSVIPIYLLGEKGILIVIGPVIIGLGVHSLVGKLYTRGYQLTSFNRQYTFLAIKKSFKDSKYFGRSSVVTDVANLDTPLIAILLSVSDSGTYSLFQKFRGPLITGFQSFSNSFKPIVARGNKKEIRELLVSEKWLLILNVCGILIFAAFCLKYSQSYLGNSFNDVNLILCIGSLSALPTALSFLCSTYLTSSGLEKLNARILTLFVPVLLIAIAVTAHVSGLVQTTINILVINILLSCVLTKKAYDHWTKA
jgi:O-antigen/teichoic acid export membrane protein